MKIKLSPLLLLLGCAVLLVAGERVSACSCVEKGPPCAAYGNAQAVFVGKVVGGKEQRDSTDENGQRVKYDVGEIYFQVEESFLGVKGTRVVIHSGTGGGDCGYWFRHGGRDGLSG